MTQKQKINQLVDRIRESDTTVGRAVVNRVHEMLWDLARQSSDVSVSGDECPEGDPSCDPPGDEKGDDS